MPVGLTFVESYLLPPVALPSGLNHLRPEPLAELALSPQHPGIGNRAVRQHNRRLLLCLLRCVILTDISPAVLLSFLDESRLEVSKLSLGDAD
jgi:hypothetical protein